MDAISDRAFQDQSTPGSTTNSSKLLDETPSLLSVILDINPLEWNKLHNQDPTSFKQLISALLVMLNAHLALNSGNKVALYTGNSFNHGARLVYPLDSQTTTTTKTPTTNTTNTNTFNRNSKYIESNGMSRQFKQLDETILSQLNLNIQEMPNHLNELNEKEKIKGTLTGAISMSLSYINKLQTTSSNLNKARILIVSLSDDSTIPYISIMNTIFASQKMKIPIDILKLNNDSTFLQQASDSTNGVYIKLSNLSGLVEYLCTTLFIDPMLRSTVLVIPSNSNVDFRASCFVTNKIVDVGYVCSVCLCILSILPDGEKCPTCGSKFDHGLMAKLKRKPKVLPLISKKRKKVSNENSSTVVSSDTNSTNNVVQGT